MLLQPLQLIRIPVPAPHRSGFRDLPDAATATKDIVWPEELVDGETRWVFSTTQNKV